MLVYKAHLNVYKGPIHSSVGRGQDTKRCTVIISQYQLAKSAAERSGSPNKGNLSHDVYKTNTLYIVILGLYSILLIGK